MPNEITIHQHSIAEITTMAQAVAKSGMFGMKTPEQAMVLMLIAQAEGIHPVTAAMDYDVIQGKPAKKSQAMLKSFLANGGKVEWHARTDEKVDATFSHPVGGTVRIDWDMERAAKAGLKGKDNWGKFPRQMLAARCISEGVRTVYPGATGGLYVPEEIAEFDNKPQPMQDVTPQPKQETLEAKADAVIAETQSYAIESLKVAGKQAAQQGNLALDEWIKKVPSHFKKRIADECGADLRKIANEVDANLITVEE